MTTACWFDKDSRSISNLNHRQDQIKNQQILLAKPMLTLLPW